MFFLDVIRRFRSKKVKKKKLWRYEFVIIIDALNISLDIL